MWQNFGTPSIPVYTQTELSDDTVSVTSKLFLQNAQSCTAIIAVYNADDKMVGITALGISGNGEYNISVSCSEELSPLYAKAFILGTGDNILNPLSKVPFTENLIY